ncbi:hypothetical protein TSOC_004288, partial [Tetrabaena socialis]
PVWPPEEQLLVQLRERTTDGEAWNQPRLGRAFARTRDIHIGPQRCPYFRLHRAQLPHQVGRRPQQALLFGYSAAPSRFAPGTGSVPAIKGLLPPDGHHTAPGRLAQRRVRRLPGLLHAGMPNTAGAFPRARTPAVRYPLAGPNDGGAGRLGRPAAHVHSQDSTPVFLLASRSLLGRGCAGNGGGAGAWGLQLLNGWRMRGTALAH